MDQSTTSPNADQITYWNARAGNTWASMHKRLDAQIGSIGLKAMDALALREGEHVIDIGCGCGTTSFQIARRVAASGRVEALDISQPMLEVARRDAAHNHVHNVTFIEADAQTYAFEPAAHDALYSRFGVMFFSDPVAAFRNLLAALKPRSGRLAFVCWRPLNENPWMEIPLKAAMQHLPPQKPPDPLAPGPYAFADAERVKRILREAGFVNVLAAPHDQKVSIGQLDDAVEHCTRVGPLSRLLLEYPEAVGPVTETLRCTLHDYETDGLVRMHAAVWIVSAGRP